MDGHSQFQKPATIQTILVFLLVEVLANAFKTSIEVDAFVISVVFLNVSTLELLQAGTVLAGVTERIVLLSLADAN